MARTIQVVSSFPNPFTASTQITFTLPKNDYVTLHVYNGAGKLVGDLCTRKSMKKGYHSIAFDGATLPRGTYYYVLATSEGTWSNSMMRVD